MLVQAQRIRRDMAIRTAAASSISSNYFRQFDASVEFVDQWLVHQQEADSEEAEYVRSDAAEVNIIIISR